MKILTSRSDNYERSRWEEKHGDPLKFDVKLGPGFIQIGDEIFTEEDLDAYPIKPRVQPEGHPIKRNHYDLQKELSKLRADLEKVHNRKLAK